MPRYEFTSPLAAAGRGIEEFLTERRAEERQRLLDEIARRDAEQTRKLREEQIAASLQQREIQRLGVATAGREPGAEVSGLPADIRDIGIRHGIFGPRPKGPTPTITVDETFRRETGEPIEAGPSLVLSEPPQATMSDTGLYFRGSAEDLKEQRELQRAGDVISAMYASGDPEQARMATMLAVANAMRIQPPAQALVPRERMQLYLPETGEFKEAPRPGPVDVVPRPPQPQRPSFAFGGIAVGTNRPVTVIDGVPHTINDQGKLVVYTGGVTNRPTISQRREGPVLSVGVMQKGAALRAKAATTKARLDVNNYMEWRTGAVATANVSDPSVREAVHNALDANDPRSAEEIGAELSQDPESTPTEVAEFIELLRAVRGK